MISFSIIVPVFNRPEEICDLLQSLKLQSDQDFEIIIVEDGSDKHCKEIINSYNNKLNIKYFFKNNEGPAIARNYGINKASGNYFIFFDSDCIIPPEWMKKVRQSLDDDYVDAFGGPDSAAPEFNATQKAISYTMTSFITTGGIRGGAKQVGKFFPRSFNMGISKEVFEKTGGFPITKMHPGEDMILSIEIIKNGFSTKLVPDAFVYHKRRTNFPRFFKQVFGFGKTRYLISLLYPETFKIFFLAPTIFLVGSIGLIICSILFHYLFISPLILFLLLIFTDSFIKTKSLKTALYAIIAGFFQLFAYGTGFLSAIWHKSILRMDEFELFGSASTATTPTQTTPTPPK